jgi:DNA polymerase-3 subunit epsilon
MSSISERTDAVRQLKREKRYAEAIPILESWIGEEESQSASTGWGVAPWPYEQLAIIHRKVQDHRAEVAILERFAAQWHGPGAKVEKLRQRLLKAYELAELLEHRTVDGVSVAFHSERQMPVAHLDAFLRTAAVVDVETTGLTTSDELIEIGLVLFRYSKWSGEVVEVLKEYRGLRQPGCRMSRSAQAVHGYSKSDLRGKSLDDAAVRQILDDAETLFAHNAPFDRRYVSKLYPESFGKRWVCTMNGVAWKAYGHGSRKLDILLQAHGIERDRAHHALDDAHGLLRLLSAKPAANSPPHLYELLSYHTLDTQSSGATDRRRTRSPMTIRVRIGEENESKSGCASVLAVVVIVSLAAVLALLA